MTLNLSEQTCDWNAAIEEFLLDMEAIRAKNTHLFYSAQLRSLRTWAEGEGIAFNDFRKSHLNRYNTRCNAICPGFVPSGIHGTTAERNTKSIGIEIHLPQGSPAINQGWGKPQDVANTALFLASEQSSHISGVEIYVDGVTSLL